MPKNMPKKTQEQASDRVERELFRRILAGVYKSGAPLPPNRQLASELGVSRNTLTVVMGRLSARGYLEPAPREALVVRDLARALDFRILSARVSAVEAAPLLQQTITFFASVFGELVQLAAAARRSDHLYWLRLHLTELEHASRCGQLAVVAKAQHQLWWAVANASGNLAFLALVNLCEAVLVERAVGPLLEVGDWATLVSAIKDGDPFAARQTVVSAAQRHLARLGHPSAVERLAS